MDWEERRYSRYNCMTSVSPITNLHPSIGSYRVQGRSLMLARVVERRYLYFLKWEDWDHAFSLSLPPSSDAGSQDSTSL